ncbi:MAG: UTP--glucose-1-phosphate uridylyltransferase, partial [Halanaerobiales bacterium]
MKVKKAVIPAAGYGTRLLPASKSIPKEMIPIVDRPTIQYVVEEALEAGIEEILIITSKNKQEIENYFDRDMELDTILVEKGKMKLKKEIDRISNMVDLHYVRQKKQKGLGHAVACAETFVGNDPFAVLLGDDVVISDKPVIGQLAEEFEKKEAPILGVQDVSDEDVHKYGIVKYSKKEGGSYLLE